MCTNPEKVAICEEAIGGTQIKLICEKVPSYLIWPAGTQIWSHQPGCCHLLIPLAWSGQWYASNRGLHRFHSFKGRNQVLFKDTHLLYTFLWHDEEKEGRKKAGRGRGGSIIYWCLCVSVQIKGQVKILFPKHTSTTLNRCQIGDFETGWEYSLGLGSASYIAQWAPSQGWGNSAS